MSSPRALIADTVPFSNVDGPGNRFVVFFQGCNFDCIACHNPSTIAVCTHSATRERSVDDLLVEIRRAAPFLSGITVSGGEATLQAPFVAALYEVASSIEAIERAREGPLSRPFLCRKSGVRRWAYRLPLDDPGLQAVARRVIQVLMQLSLRIEVLSNPPNRVVDEPIDSKGLIAPRGQIPGGIVQIVNVQNVSVAGAHAFSREVSIRVVLRVSV